MHPPVAVVSAGLVLFRQVQNRVEYLLLKNAQNTTDIKWTPPKGVVLPGDCSLETAKNATKSWTGYTDMDYTLLAPKHHYRLTEISRKETMFYLAELSNTNKTVMLNKRFSHSKWATTIEARSLMKCTEHQLMIRHFDGMILARTFFG